MNPSKSRNHQFIIQPQPIEPENLFITSQSTGYTDPDISRLQDFDELPVEKVAIGELQDELDQNPENDDLSDMTSDDIKNMLANLDSIEVLDSSEVINTLSEIHDEKPRYLYLIKKALRKKILFRKIRKF